MIWHYTNSTTVHLAAPVGAVVFGLDMRRFVPLVSRAVIDLGNNESTNVPCSNTTLFVVSTAVIVTSRYTASSPLPTVVGAYANPDCILLMTLGALVRVRVAAAQMLAALGGAV
jgi:hypothetical protein